MEIYVLIQSNKKSGKVVNVVTAMGMAMLKIWALQHTSKTRQTFIKVAIMRLIIMLILKQKN